jgi:hypothetical protein
MLAAKVGWAAALALLASYGPPRGVVRAGGANEDVACVDYWPEVRRKASGFDHVIHLYSRCAVRAYCTVSSDRSPKPERVVVAPRSIVEVLAFRSPTPRRFTPEVTCRFRL